ncbi:MAG: hypothetical protein KGD65_12845 [Candidatus Lokiarchaeota archaeon]|nr:hypothetical protein [Candidatus Lokiarchaeota archaeon]
MSSNGTPHGSRTLAVRRVRLSIEPPADCQSAVASLIFRTPMPMLSIHPSCDSEATALL